MSLENVTLSPYMLQNLYRKNLVYISKDKSADKPGNSAIKFLGGNRKNILILTETKADAFINETDLLLLAKILEACKLTLEDVALVNIATLNKNERGRIVQDLASEKIIISGADASAINLPFRIPHFQLQKHADKIYVTTPSLKILAADKKLKAELWQSFQKLFNVK